MAAWLHTIIDLAAGAEPAELRAWLTADDEGALKPSRGRLWGLWAGGPGIGLRSDQLALMTVWPDDSAAGAAIEILKAAPAVHDVQGTPLRATARPADATPCSGDGIWVLRDFEIDAAGAETFVDLSRSAWDHFETNFDASIAGLSPVGRRAKDSPVNKHANKGCQPGRMRRLSK